MIKIDRSLCTECLLCMGICSWVHFNASTTKRARIRVEAIWPQVPMIGVCLACREHECVSACPHKALTWKAWIRLDPGKCDACGMCADACPVNGVHLDPVTGHPLICDTCEGDFSCVVWCPTQALKRNPRP